MEDEVAITGGASGTGGRRDVLTALFFAGELILSFVGLGFVGYEVNDDMVITALLKGLFGFTSGSDGIFLSPLLGWLLGEAYRLAPFAQWYSLLLYFGLFVACFSTVSIFFISFRHWLYRSIGLLVTTVFYFKLSVSINFGAVSLVLWVSACALLMLLARGKLGGVAWLCLGVCQLCAAYLIRPDIFLLLVALAVPLAGLSLKSCPRVLIWVVTGVLCTVAVNAVFAGAVRSGDDYRNYEEFTRVRSEFMDTKRSAYNEQTRGALFEVGWTTEDYDVARNWWLHDGEQFSASKIQAFLEKNGNKTSVINFKYGISSLNKYKHLLLLLITWCIFVIFTSYKSDFKNDAIFKYLIYSVSLATILFIAFIRFPDRVAVPSFMMLLIFFTALFSDKIYEKYDNKSIIAAFIVFIIVGGIGLDYLNKRNYIIAYEAAFKNSVDFSTDFIIKNNGSDTLIVDVNPHKLPLTYAPFQENHSVLKSKILLGGWTIGSTPYLELLSKAGLHDRKSAVPSMINNRKVVLRFWDAPSLPYDRYVRQIFLRHLRMNYGRLFPGSVIQIQPAADLRTKGAPGPSGVIFFKLVTSDS